MDRTVFVISDLHVGGDVDETTGPRGFRLLTHVAELTGFVRGLVERTGPTELIINGDFVDFLAETDQDGWLPFVFDPNTAARRLTKIIERDKAFFHALRDLLARGHQLTVLLGNHDVELALPKVRRTLERHLEVKPTSPFKFIYDGEAYTIGDAIIEHGNDYDEWNRVEHEKLLPIRKTQSCAKPMSNHDFKAPLGSHLVSKQMNPLKKSGYPWVDLLKPEKETVIPLLLAFDPGLRAQILKLYSLKCDAEKRAKKMQSQRVAAGDIAAQSEALPRPDELLFRDLSKMMSPSDARWFLDEVIKQGPPPSTSGDIASGGPSTWTLIQLMAKKKDGDVASRIPILRKAFAVLKDHATFSREKETDEQIEAAARRHAKNGFRWVLFGHTHLAKNFKLDDHTTYLNTGTWADLIELPNHILGEDESSRVAFQSFIEDMASDNYTKWVKFVPTYVKMDVKNGRVVNAELKDYPS
jgi:UDP-2,3-diacylglucosamine pyrophosphatase LpxH